MNAPHAISLRRSWFWRAGLVCLRSPQYAYNAPDGLRFSVTALVGSR